MDVNLLFFKANDVHQQNGRSGGEIHSRHLKEIQHWLYKRKYVDKTDIGH